MHKYSKALRCRSCGVSRARRGVPNPARRRGETRMCKQCTIEFWNRHSDDRQFCSAKCANKHKTVHARLDVQCKECGVLFVHAVKPRSNSPGNFCSLSCRNASYRKNYRGSKLVQRARYSGWRSIRNAFVRRGNDFCFLCGKSDVRLTVHHIEPHRISQRNDTHNLVTVCPKCHSYLEPFSTRLALESESIRNDLIYCIKAEIEDIAQIRRGRLMLLARDVLRKRLATT